MYTLANAALKSEGRSKMLIQYIMDQKINAVNQLNGNECFSASSSVTSSSSSPSGSASYSFSRCSSLAFFNYWFFLSFFSVSPSSAYSFSASTLDASSSSSLLLLFLQIFRFNSPHMAWRFHSTFSFSHIYLLHTHFFTAFLNQQLLYP